MSTLTLGEAKPLLSGYASNGVCSTDPRVVENINEAQFRLYSQGPWLGSLARYVVATQTGPTTGTFFYLPEAIENPSRVVRYDGASPIPTIQGVLLTDGVGAFVGTTGPVLPVVTAHNSVRTIGVPSGVVNVDVTGSKVYSDAVNDTDSLFITDVTALKLMLLALWRERNDRLDLAEALEKKAVARLTQILNTAVDEARRLTYQISNESFTYGTVGWARVKLSTDLRQGVSRDDPFLLDLLNKAEDLLISRHNYFILNNRLGVKDNLPLLVHRPLYDDLSPLPVPNYQILKLAAAAIVASNAADPNALQTSQALEEKAYELLDKELKIQLCESRRAIYEAEFLEFQTATTTLGYFRTRLALDLPGDAGLMITNEELIRKINEAEEFAMTQGSYKNMRKTLTFTIPQDGVLLLPLSVESVLAASIGGRAAPVWGSEFDYNPNGYGYGTSECPRGSNRLVSRGESNGRRQYFVKDACAPDCAHFYVKLRFIPKTNDGDIMVVTNYPVMRVLVESLFAADANTRFGMQKTALSMLDNELKEHQGTERAQLVIDNPTSFGNIPALI